MPEKTAVSSFSQRMPLGSLTALMGGVGMGVCQWLILVYAPLEKHMGLTQKIFYLHLPMAWWALFSFFVVFVASIASMKTRHKRWESLADSAAELGVLLAGLALATGSIWAKAAWWRWWIWDHRLTTTLIMWFIYAGYLVVRRLDMQPAQRAILKAAIGIIAFLDVPLVFFATRLWESNHPSGVISSSDALEPEMRVTLIASLAAFGFLWFALLYVLCRIERIRHTIFALRGMSA